MRPRSALWLVAFASTACDGGRVHIPYPDVAGHASMIVVTESDTSVRAEAFDISDGALPPIKSIETRRVTLLFYDLGLGALGLRAGPIAEADDAVCSSEPLPVSDASHVYRPASETAFDVSPPPARVLEFRRELPCPCVELRSTTIELEGVQKVIGIARLDDKTALVASRDWLFEINVETSELLDDRPATSLIGAFCTDARGDALIGLQNGAITRYRSGTMELEPFLTVPDNAGVKALGCAPAGQTEELFVVDTLGRVLRSTGGPLEVVYDEPNATDTSMLAAAAWLAPGVGSMTQENGVNLVNFNASAARTTRLEPWGVLDPRGPLQSLTRVPGLGLVATTGTNRILQRRDPAIDEWNDLKVDEMINNADAVAPFREDEMFVAAGPGLTIQYAPKKQFCPGVDLGVVDSISTISAFSDDIVLFGTDPMEGSRPPQVVIGRVVLPAQRDADGD